MIAIFCTLSLLILLAIPLFILSSVIPNLINNMLLSFSFLHPFMKPPSKPATPPSKSTVTLPKFLYFNLRHPMKKQIYTKIQKPTSIETTKINQNRKIQKNPCQIIHKSSKRKKKILWIVGNR